MTITRKKIYGKMYTYDRSTRFKKDAKDLAEDWKRDGDKTAVVKVGKNPPGERVYDVFWRRL